MNFRYRKLPKWDWEPKTELEEIYGRTDYELHDGYTLEQAKKWRQERKDSWNAWMINRYATIDHNHQVTQNYLLLVIAILTIIIVYINLNQ